MAIYWRTQKTYAGFGYWTLANVAMTVTFSLFALKGIAPEFLTVVVANTVAVVGAACRYAGVRFFWGAEKLAASDMLTGLYNRRKLEELCSQEVAAARERTRVSSMLLIDLDYLKQVNDTFGHPAGDALIISVVKIIRSQLRDSDILGRLGSDEFIEFCQRPRMNPPN